MVNFNVDWQSDQTILKDHEVLSFQKCIDSQANITVSAKLTEIEDLPEPMTKVSIVQRRQIPKPESVREHRTIKTQNSVLESYTDADTDARIQIIDDDDDFANMEDVSETCDEG